MSVIILAPQNNPSWPPTSAVIERNKHTSY